MEKDMEYYVRISGKAIVKNVERRKELTESIVDEYIKSNKKDISVTPPMGLFEREIFVNCGTSMIDRLQNAGQTMQNEVVHDKLLLTW